MYIKINSPKNYGNAGSCVSMVQYLEKENIDLIESTEVNNFSDFRQFFNPESDMISSHEVIKSIDKNTLKLGKDDARYYMISINPSQKEMHHIASEIAGRRVTDISQFTGGERKKFENYLKTYSREVMDIYAKNFNKGLSGKDIVYYGKVEHERKYSRKSEEVKNGIHKIGELKEGFQSHVHIVVSRKDITNSKKLSPFSNHKNSKNILNGKEVQIGFNRKEFVQNCEGKFDDVFNYNRDYAYSFDYRYTMKNTASRVAASYGRYFANKAMPGYYKIDSFSRISKSISNGDPMQALSNFVAQNKEIAKVMKAMKMASSPQKAAIELAKKIPQAIDKATTLSL